MGGQRVGRYLLTWFLPALELAPLLSGVQGAIPAPLTEEWTRWPSERGQVPCCLQGPWENTVTFLGPLWWTHSSGPQGPPTPRSQVGRERGALGGRWG